MSGDPDPCHTVEIDVAEPCPGWRRHLDDIERLCRAAAAAALAGPGTPLDGPTELSLVLGDDALVQALNRRWRGQDRPTNVLAFPAQSPAASGAPRLLGDVVLAFETVAREAEAQRKPLAHHVIHLVTHGVLHLLGFDHETAAEAERMEAIERTVLARQGIPDPYRVTEASDG